MGTAMSSIKPGDDKLTIYSAGPANLNAMGMEFTNISERTLKSNGIKARLIKVPQSWIEENITQVDYLAFFSKPKEPVSKLVDLADAKDIEVGIYRY
jgi:hypothetical protein